MGVLPSNNGFLYRVNSTAFFVGSGVIGIYRFPQPTLSAFILFVPATSFLGGMVVAIPHLFEQ